MSADHPQNDLNGTRDCGTFFLDVLDQFANDQVRVTWSNLTRPTNGAVDELIEKSWQDHTRKAKATGARLFDGQLCRMISYNCDDGRLELTLGPVSFKEFIGTNATQAYVRHLHGPEVMADPLGVSAAVCTNDDFIVMGVRSRSVIQYAGRIHPIGGTVDRPREDGVPPDPFATILNELWEETAIRRDKIIDVLCLGLVRDRNTVQPEMIFDCRVDCDVVTLFASAANASDADEHSSLVPVRDHPGTVVSFMEQHFAQLTPVAMATLLLHGMRHWGSGWFATARGYLRSVI